MLFLCQVRIGMLQGEDILLLSQAETCGNNKISSPKKKTLAQGGSNSTWPSSTMLHPPRIRWRTSDVELLHHVPQEPLHLNLCLNTGPESEDRDAHNPEVVPMCCSCKNRLRSCGHSIVDASSKEMKRFSKANNNRAYLFWEWLCRDLKSDYCWRSTNRHISAQFAAPDDIDQIARCCCSATVLSLLNDIHKQRPLPYSINQSYLDKN